MSDVPTDPASTDVQGDQPGQDPQEGVTDGGELDVDAAAAGLTEPQLAREADDTDPGSLGGDNGGA